MNTQLKMWLDGKWVPVLTGRFPDGAVWGNVGEALPEQAEKLVIRARAMQNMDDFMCLAQILDAVRQRCDVRLCYLQLAWLPYARQDRYMGKTDSFALSVFARFLNTLQFDRVFVLDPHSEAACAAIDNMVVIPQSRCLIAHTELRHALASGELMLVAPDAGALKKIHDVALAANAQAMAIMTKSRDISTGALSGFALVSGDVSGRDVLIADDLCDAGGTFIGAAAVLRDAGARSISLYVTHGVFSKGVENLLNQGIEKIYTTTSYASSNLASARVSLVDIDTLFAA